MFSKELHEMDKNTIQYMIEEQQEIIDKQAKELERQRQEAKEQAKKLEKEISELKAKLKGQTSC